MDSDSGEFQEKRLSHRQEAEKFYRALAGQKVRVGMEASGHAGWFERLVDELQFELRIGDVAEIRTKRVRKQKTVIVLGNQLKGTTSVAFNGTAASFTVISSTEIKTSVPTGATTGFVKVTTPKKTLKSNVVFRVTK